MVKTLLTNVNYIVFLDAKLIIQFFKPSNIYWFLVISKWLQRINKNYFVTIEIYVKFSYNARNPVIVFILHINLKSGEKVILFYVIKLAT